MELTVTSLADSGSGSLRDVIAQATSGDIIKFNVSPNSTITLTSGQIEIPAGKILTIDGLDSANLRISGNDSSRIFNITSRANKPSGLNIKNLTLTHAKSNDLGGAINIEGLGGNLNIDNVNFYDNVAQNGGGAIYVAYNASTLDITNSSFKRNIATAGNNERGGGAIAFKGPLALKVKNSEFIENLGINGGAINNLQGKLLIENCQFLNNSTTAAFYDTGNLNPFLRGHGGAIFTDRASAPDETSGYITIINSVFDGNQGEGQGGALSLYTVPADKVTVEGSTFNNNSVVAQENGNLGNGGAIMQISDAPNQGFSVKNSTFSNNTATNQGGAIYKNYSPTDIINSTFFNNQVENPNNLASPSVVGGALSLYGPANVTNSTFSHNSAAWVAGAIAANIPDVVVTNTIFDNNTAANGGNPWKIKYNTSRQLTDGGNNIQYPDLVSTGSNIPNDNYATANILVADPKLGPLQDNGGLTKTMALLLGSPAIDGGTNVNAPTTDQRGTLRPMDGDGNGTEIVDVGAYEVIPEAEIQVLDDNIDIVDGSSTSINIGSTPVGTPLIKTFTIKNQGIKNLNLSDLQLPTGFSLVGNFPSFVGPSMEVSLQIQMNAIATGRPSGIVSFTNDDQNESPFNFSINGVVFNLVNGTSSNDNINRSSVSSSIDELISGFQGNDTITAGGGNDTIEGGTDHDSLIGSTGDDSLVGGVGNDSLRGGAGNNILTGGLGDDSYIIDGTDTIAETITVTTEIDNVQVSVSYTLGSNLEILSLTGTSSINGSGNQLNNTLIGNTANNILNGDIGNDTLNGGLGSDTLNGGLGNDSYLIDGADTIIETNTVTTEIDTVQAAFSYTLGNNLEILAFTSTSNINGTGNALNNDLRGNSANNILNGVFGNDTLNGGIGIDTLNGGLGNDIYFIDATDTITETSTITTEIDTVQASFNYTLGNNLEILTLTGSSNINGTGNQLDNNLMGNSGNNSLIGSIGIDTLNGGAGNDTLIGGIGNDFMIGSTGSDLFTFNAINQGVDRLVDFDPITDTIQISASGFGGGLIAGGVITPSQFVNGTNATNSQAQFIYNNNVGTLLFDVDGTGSLAAVQIAFLNNQAAITNADIFIIA